MVVILFVVLVLCGLFLMKTYGSTGNETNSVLHPSVPASAMTSSDSPIARDATHVWFNGNVVDGADPATFVLMPTSPSGKVFGRDRYHVYEAQGSTLVEVLGADPRTFVAP